MTFICSLLNIDVEVVEFIVSTKFDTFVSVEPHIGSIACVEERGLVFADRDNALAVTFITDNFI